MSTNSKKKITIVKGSRSTQTNTVKDYGNDPYFVRKADEAQAFLEKVGFPKEMISKK